jgi:hypothetical protein
MLFTFLPPFFQVGALALATPSSKTTVWGEPLFTVLLY